MLSIKDASAAIHVGFWRPETQKIAELAQAWPGALLLSNAAIGSLPPPTKISSHSVGEVDGLQFLLALAGFGYEIPDPTQSAVAVPLFDASPMFRTSSEFDPSGWVEQILQAQPQHEQHLRDAGIWDEESYIASENLLDMPLRLAMSLARYVSVSGELPQDSGILNNLHACPPWFLSDNLKNLALSVRMNNVFKGNNLVTIADIATKGLNGLLKLPNLGLGSVQGLEKLLFESFIHGDALKRLPSNMIEMAFKPTGIASTESEISPVKGRKTIEVDFSLNPQKYEIHDLLSGCIDAASSLTENEREIFEARLGYQCKSHSLQQIAYQLGINRERVRQIEIKIFRRIKNHAVWRMLAYRLDRHLVDRSSPLLLAGISAIDPWFKDVEELENSLTEIFKHLFDNRFSIIRIDDVPVITHVSNIEWMDAIESGNALLNGMVSDKPDEDYARLQIEALLSDKGAELRETIWRKVSSLALWASRETGTRRLLGYGRTVEAVVTAVLEDAGMPLHYTEIERRASQFSGRTFEARRLHHVAASVGMLYARGTYGLLSQCPLSNEERDLIVVEVEDIISTGDVTRQWHTSELMDELLDRGLDFDGRISKYIINIALQFSEILVYLKRMVWGLKGSWNESAASRLDLRQAVISLLEGEGTSMSTADLREKLFSGRGVNSHFQIHPAGNLIRIGAGRWGLSDRDTQLKDPAAYMDRIEQYFAKTEEGIHVSEVSTVLGDLNEDISTALFGYCKGKGLKIDRAQYLYPAAWLNSRRIWPNVAVRISLDSGPTEGISFDEIFSTVCRLTKRTLKKIQISQILVVMEESIFDAATEKWRINSELIVDADADEELGQGV